MGLKQFAKITVHFLNAVEVGDADNSVCELLVYMDYELCTCKQWYTVVYKMWTIMIVIKTHL